MLTQQPSSLTVKSGPPGTEQQVMSYRSNTWIFWELKPQRQCVNKFSREFVRILKNQTNIKGKKTHIPLVNHTRDTCHAVPWNILVCFTNNPVFLHLLWSVFAKGLRILILLAKIIFLKELHFFFQTRNTNRLNDRWSRISTLNYSVTWTSTYFSTAILQIIQLMYFLKCAIYK